MFCLDFLWIQCPILVYEREISRYYSIFLVSWTHGATKPGFQVAAGVEIKERLLSDDNTGNTSNNFNKLKIELYIY